ncbi:hypothetical protein BS78_05G113400 [Paspalum vaginatum]|nr:hypothetical protein BS78_05G113400 [Paspalum vaginatum]KAJ1275133.1 hypothetical protein BS78_05G113400 [Paspalum vaginatum]KAJ1275134.1 hypothetical protein BS78_05G113400 [Paspalum vaginatum]
MDGRLLDAATSGDSITMKHLALEDPGVLLGTTAQGNTCLHISTIHGHEKLCMDALALNPSLLSAVNADEETPLVTAVASGHTILASNFLRCCRELDLSGDAILRPDKHGCNALHHAIRRGRRELAMELINAEPALSYVVNNYSESPMFIAVMRDYVDVLEKLLGIPESSDRGAYCYNALHAAVRNGNSVIADKIVKTRAMLAREEGSNSNTPIQLAVVWNKIDVLKVLLEYDRSLGYVVSSSGAPLLVSAAYRGHVGIARELLRHCPDAPLVDTEGFTCLHTAVWNEQPEFLEFALSLPQLNRFVNMRNRNGDTPLHLAVQKCNPKMVAALLAHQHIDVTVLNNNGNPANWNLYGIIDHAKTLNWNEVVMLMLKSDPKDASSILNLYKEAKDIVTESSRKDIKSLTEIYTGNTSLVAILIATMTFAAAFTLPGGSSSDAAMPGARGFLSWQESLRFRHSWSPTPWQCAPLLLLPSFAS